MTIWKDRIKAFYDDKVWDISRVGLAVFYGKITSDEFKEITGLDYIDETKGTE